MKSSVSHIVHNAWKVDFNHGLSSFETHIAGTRKLVDFAASLPQSVSLLFTSSVSVAGKWNTSNGPVPETVLDKPELATTNGYSASKYVAEQVDKHKLMIKAQFLIELLDPRKSGSERIEDHNA